MEVSSKRIGIRHKVMVYMNDTISLTSYTTLVSILLHIREPVEPKLLYYRVTH